LTIGFAASTLLMRVIATIRTWWNTGTMTLFHSDTTKCWTRCPTCPWAVHCKKTSSSVADQWEVHFCYQDMSLYHTALSPDPFQYNDHLESFSMNLSPPRNLVFENDNLRHTWHCTLTNHWIPSTRRSLSMSTIVSLDKIHFISYRFDRNRRVWIVHSDKYRSPLIYLHCLDRRK
jgi:hypothetical protein